MNPGRPPRVDDEDVLDVLRSADDPVLTASEVADQLPLGKRAVLNRLHDLVDAGDVAKKDVGARSTVWWAVDEQPEQRAPTPSEEIDGAGAGDSTVTQPATVDVDEILEGWPPKGERKREERREAGAAVLEWLREQNEPQSAEDFKDALLPDHGVEGQGADTWWKKTARPALNNALDARVVNYREGYHDYQWTGE